MQPLRQGRTPSQALENRFSGAWMWLHETVVVVCKMEMTRLDMYPAEYSGGQPFVNTTCVSWSS